MEPLKIRMLCDADYCNCSAGRRSGRETTTVAECERLYRQASERRCQRLTNRNSLRKIKTIHETLKEVSLSTRHQKHGKRYSGSVGLLMILRV